MVAVSMKLRIRPLANYTGLVLCASLCFHWAGKEQKIVFRDTMVINYNHFSQAKVLPSREVLLQNFVFFSVLVHWRFFFSLKQQAWLIPLCSVSRLKNGCSCCLEWVRDVWMSVRFPDLFLWYFQLKVNHWNYKSILNTTQNWAVSKTFRSIAHQTWYMGRKFTLLDAPSPRGGSCRCISRFAS